MTSYPASSTAFLSSILLNSRSYEIIASLSFKDTFAEAPATLLIAFVIYKQVQKKKQGGCGGNCAGCSGCSSFQVKDSSVKKKGR